MADPSGAGNGIFDRHLDRTPANHAPLTPLSFLERAASVYPDKAAVIHGDRTFSYRIFRERCRRLASSLAGCGVGPGDTVAVLAGNIPATLEAHYGVPMLGAVLNALNIRLDARTVAFCLAHGEAKVLIVDREFTGLAAQALARLERPPVVIDVEDPEATRRGAPKHRPVRCRTRRSSRPATRTTPGARRPMSGRRSR